MPLGDERETALRDWVACSVHASMFIGCGGEGLGAPSCVNAGALGKIAIFEPRAGLTRWQYRKGTFVVNDI